MAVGDGIEGARVDGASHGGTILDGREGRAKRDFSPILVLPFVIGRVLLSLTRAMLKTPTLYLIALGVSASVAGFALARLIDPDAGSDSELSQGGDKLSAVTTSVIDQELEALAAKIVAMDDGGALSELLESFGGDEHGRIGRQLAVERWAQVDPQGAFAGLRDNWQFLKPFLIEWASIDPEATTRQMIAAKYNGYGSIAPQLALRAPEKCLELIAAWERDSPEVQSWEAAMPTRLAFSKVYADDPEKALALLETLPEERRAAAVAGIAKAMGELDLAAAQSWAEALESRDEREAALGMVAALLAKHDPAAALLLLRTLQDPMDRQGHFTSAGARSCAR